MIFKRKKKQRAERAKAFADTCRQALTIPDLPRVVEDSIRKYSGLERRPYETLNGYLARAAGCSEQDVERLIELVTNGATVEEAEAAIRIPNQG